MIRGALSARYLRDQVAAYSALGLLIGLPIAVAVAFLGGAISAHRFPLNTSALALGVLYLVLASAQKPFAMLLNDLPGLWAQARWGCIGAGVSVGLTVLWGRQFGAPGAYGASVVALIGAQLLPLGRRSFRKVRASTSPVVVPNTGVQLEPADAGEIDVVVVCHDSLAQATSLIESMWPGRTDAAKDHLIFVDSGSVERGYELLAPRILVTIPNLGYGSAANLGVLLSKTEWVAIANPDCRIRYEDLVHLAEAGSQLGAAVVAPALEGRNGAPIDHFTELPGPAWKRDVMNRPSQCRSDAWEVAGVVGALMLVHRPTFLRAGGFDWGFFLYGEEIEFASRLRDAGERSFYVTSVTARHLGEASSVAVDPAWRSAQRLRGKCRYVRKRHGRLWACATALVSSLRLFHAYSAAHALRAIASATKDPRAGLQVPSDWLEADRMLRESPQWAVVRSES